MAKMDKNTLYTPYTPEEIKILWDNVNLGIPFQNSEVYPVDTILIAIYTGMRPGELLELENEKINIEERHVIVSSRKTGTDRTIQIHEDIYQLIKKRKDEGGKYFIKFRSDTPLTLRQYEQYYFIPIMEQLSIYHSPYDARHTYLINAQESKQGAIK